MLNDAANSGWWSGAPLCSEGNPEPPRGDWQGEWLENWTPETAQALAQREGLGELTETQWRVIYTLRGMYFAHGRASSARQVIRRLARDFSAEGGRNYLYRAFPRGPVRQGCRLAGVPAPLYPGEQADGFGAAHCSSRSTRRRSGAE